MPAYLLLAALLALATPMSLAATPAAAGDTTAPAATAPDPDDDDEDSSELVDKAQGNADAVDDLDADDDDGHANYEDRNDGDKFDVDR